jgi:hypothetical protein
LALKYNLDSRVPCFKPVFLATWKAEIGGITVQSHPREKVCKIPISTNRRVWWLTPVIPVTRGSINKGTEVQADLGIRRDPFPKITKAKGLGKRLKW